jgi:DNA-binding transcriptional regulator YiaG
VTDAQLDRLEDLTRRFEETAYRLEEFARAVEVTTQSLQNFSVAWERGARTFAAAAREMPHTVRMRPY